MIHMRPRGRRRMREAGTRGGLCGLALGATVPIGAVVDTTGAVGVTAGTVGDTVGKPMNRPPGVGG